MEGGKTAILFAGSSYNVQYSLKSLLENLIIPNNADVFVVTTRAMKRRYTPESPIPDASDNKGWNKKNATTIFDDAPLGDNELQYIKDILGDRLKCLHVAEEMPEYQAYINSKRQEMMNIANSYVDESLQKGIPPPWNGRHINTPEEGTVRCVVDQYNHIKKAYQFMEEYEKQNNLKYHYVMRARIDFICDFPLILDQYALNHDEPYLYTFGSFRRDVMEWADEFAWFSKRAIASQLFPHLDKMGLINTRKYNTIQYGTSYSPKGNDFIFDPETQFSLLLHELNINKIVNIKIFRSSQYTLSNPPDGYDYFNYKFRRDTIDLNYEYKLVCDLPTDINEHLPILYEYASKCKHITELGLRYGNSTVAFLKAARDTNSTFHSYDPQSNPRMAYIQQIADENNVDYKYFLSTAMNNEETESLIEETDLLFIDTNHHCIQMEKELRLHTPKVRRYVAFHDHISFGYKGQSYDNGGCGILHAIDPFMENNKDKWKLVEKRDNNNGLMIIERIGY